jgi:hypothetical protein
MIHFSAAEWRNFYVRGVSIKWGSKPTSIELRYDKVEYVLTSLLPHRAKITLDTPYKV